MKLRRTDYLILACLVFAVTLSPNEAEAGHPPPDDVRAAITHSAREFGVSAARLEKVSHCESSHNPRAEGGGGAYWGLMQHSRRYWDGRVASFQAYVDAHGRERVAGIWQSPLDNLRLAAFLAMRDGWGHWKKCA